MQPAYVHNEMIEDRQEWGHRRSPSPARLDAAAGGRKQGKRTAGCAATASCVALATCLLRRCEHAGLVGQNSRDPKLGQIQAEGGISLPQIGVWEPRETASERNSRR
jgi:hypothetical protein